MVQRELAGKTACFVMKNSSDNVENENHGQCVRTNISEDPDDKNCVDINASREKGRG
jgi:hypothetical protein